MSIIIGKLNESKIVDWEIPNFLYVSSCISTWRTGPHFNFGNATWSLGIYGKKRNCHTVYIDNASQIPSDVTCSLSIKKADGSLFATTTADVSLVFWFYDFLDFAVLQERQDELLPAGTLTITCTLEPRLHVYRKRKVTEYWDSLNKKAAFENSEHTGPADDDSLCQAYKKMLQEGKNHDIILKVGDKDFPVHRDVLSVRSRVFESMLGHNMREKNSGVIEVYDCDSKVMEQFLLYIYCGKVETLDVDDMLGLYYAADKYDVEGLKKECCNFLKKSMSPSNICDIIQTAMNHSDSDLLERATEYFIHNVECILPTDTWQSFLKDNYTVANDLLMKSVFRLKNPRVKELITIE